MGRLRRLAVVLLAALAVLPGAFLPAGPAAAATPQPGPSAPRVADPAAVPADAPRVLVRFAAGASAAERAAAIAAVGGVIDAELPALGETRLALPVVASDTTGDAAGLAALRLARQPAVGAAQLDAKASMSFTPNNPLFLTDPWFGLGQWGLRTAQVDKAWDVVRGAPQVTVAIIDTGIDANHPDLVGVALPGATFVSSPDPSCPLQSTIDDNGHGTHVAGIIAANGNSGIGIAGAAFGVRILPIKSLDCTGAGLLSDVAKGITYATDHGARVINVSLGSPADLFTLHDAVRYALAHNALVVAAAGNCGVPNPQCSAINETSYPGAYPESLAVAATDTTDQHAAFSTVASYVGISAPGYRIVSTTPTYPTTISREVAGTQNYAAFSGTSQAAPLVAGIAALVLSKEPLLAVQQLSDRLKATSDPLGPTSPNPQFGAGRVNAYRAVTQTARFAATYDVTSVPKAGTILAPIKAPVRLVNTSSFTWSAAGLTPVHLGYHWIDASGAVVVWDGARSALPADVPVGGQTTVNATIATPTQPGTYVLQLDLVQEGVSWFSAKGQPTANLAVGITTGLGATYAPTNAQATTFTLGPNTLSVSVTNTGTVAWPAGGPTPVHLGYHWLTPDGSVVVWDGARGSLPNDLQPNQNAVVALAVSSPPTLGSYVLRLDLVQEGVAWFSSQGVLPRDLAITVTSGFGASYTLGAVPVLLPGGRAVVPVTVRNDGLATWTAGGPNPVHLAAHIVDLAGQAVIWDGERGLFQADVAPGQTVTLSVAVAAPLAAGVYAVRVDLVREGIAWFSSYGVATANTNLQVAADYRAAFSTATPLVVSRAAPTITVTVTNTSSATWTPGGASPLDLSAHWLAADGSALVWDGPRAPVAQPVAPGASVVMLLPLGPPPAGATGLVIDLVSEGLRWFGVGSPRGVTLVP